ncbi:MAG: hypothetical protein WD939_05970 [Dehalococcoidia bacterium]
MRRFLILVTLISALSLAAACGGDDNGNGDPGDETPAPTQSTGIQPIPGNSELVVGPNRFAFALIDEENSPIHQTAGAGVHLRFFFGEELRHEQDAGFTWAIEDVTGFWTANVEFDLAGQWTAEADVARDGATDTVTFTFRVLEEGLAPMIGARPPASDNLTLASEPNILRVSTDPEPDEVFYKETIAEALDAGRPFVVAFATPAFCETRFCGPVLDNVKAVQPEFADQVGFIHIEPFELDDEGQLVTTPREGGGVDRVPVQAVLDWNLQSEPWIFVVGADGTIAARFEGAASVEELREAIGAALG